ncbi:MAG: beta-propeller fold lactonase family protein [Acidobacteriaceae bacterium]|nr:beta-propeller fold lactonase family protein [Acidobacteriaceae bacterium]
MDWRKTASRAVAVSVLCGLPALAGCQFFFSCESKASCGGSDTTTSSNIIYAGNSSTGSTYLNGYSNTSGVLAAVTSSPFSLGYVPSAMVVNEAGTYLYVATQTGIIYSYVISSTGTLSGVVSQAQPGYAEASMDVSPDGKWLFAIDGSTSTAPILHIYAIGTSAALTETTQVTLLSNTTYAIVPKMVRVSPDNDYIAVANGSGGSEIVAFDTSNGTVSSTVQYLGTQSSGDGDNAIAWDNNDRLYLARTTAVTSPTQYSVLVYSATSGAYVTTAIPSSYTTGTAPFSMTFADDYAYLYVGNRTDSTISMFSQASGALTSLGTVSAPTNVSALTADQSGNYVVAAGYAASGGLQIYAVGSTGGLTAQSTTEATTATTSVPTTLAATH